MNDCVAGDYGTAGASILPTVCPIRSPTMELQYHMSQDVYYGLVSAVAPS